MESLKDRQTDFAVDPLKKLGALAFASRLRRLSDGIFHDVEAIYAQSGLSFDARWFPVFYRLTEIDSAAITDLSQHLRLSHPLVIQWVKAMETQGIVTSAQDANDKRRRLVSLTEAGRKLAQDLNPYWRLIEASAQELIEGTGQDVFAMLESMENALAQGAFRSAMTARMKAHLQSQVEIVPYESRYQKDFERLNRWWLEQYFEVEPIDEEIFADPEGHILNPGGEIYIALVDGEAVGTCSLIPHGQNDGDPGYEMAKMGVDPACHGRQIGKLLAQHAIERAKQLGATELMLESNTRLTTAIALYRKLGFEAVPQSCQSIYNRCNITMVLPLVASNA